MATAIRGWALLLGAGLAGFLAAAPARAQMAPGPPPPIGPAADEVRGCLCMKRAVDDEAAALGGRQQGLDQARRELAQADAELERVRNSYDVNDPQQVARFRQMLAQRDELFRRANGEINSDVAAATLRYNAKVGEYNARCANRAFDAVLMSQVQAAPFSCPPAQ